MLRLLMILGGAFLASEFFKSKSDYPKIGGIPKEQRFTDYLIRYRIKDKESNIKQHITRSINTIVSDYDYFKIGKSGVGDSRGNNYSDFESIYLLCSSSRRDYIIELETHYNNKYFDHPKNENKRRGSAGRMSDDSGLYYLYIVVK